MANSPKLPTRVSQSALAREDATKIQAATKALGLGTPLAPARKRALVSGTNVSDQFLEKTAQVYDELGGVPGIKRFDPNQVRTAIAFRKSQGPVVAASRALTSAVEERILSVFGEAGLAALDVYAMLKVHARRQGADPAMKAHVKLLSDEMAKYRREAAARNKAEKEAHAKARAEAKGAKAGAAAGRKAAKNAGAATK